jgi:serine acetyltransferase
LPDVTLGDFTVVGAGSVVTRSFQHGYCVVAGNPARKVRDLDRTACKVPTTSDPYIGYRRKRDFDYYRAKGLLM